MATKEGDRIVHLNGEEYVEHLEEGESSSTSATNLLIDPSKSNNAHKIDQTEAQSTTLELPLSQEMIEVSTPHVSQQHQETSAHPFASTISDRVQGDGYGDMNIDPNTMNFNPPNYDGSSQILFSSMMRDDNGYNNGNQQADQLNNAESSYWGVNGYHLPLVLPPTNTLTPIHLSNPQEIMGGVNSQYPPSFLQTHTTDQWYPLNKQINIIRHPSTSPFGSEEIQFEGLLNQGASNGTFYPSGLSTNQFPPTRLNLQDGMPSSSNLHLSRNWISEGNVLSNSTTTPPTSRSPQSRNAVYDPTYESMGLPIDPHLRMFLARRDPSGDEM